jgi:hypothetical protein
MIFTASWGVSTRPKISRSESDMDFFTGRTFFRYSFEIRDLLDKLIDFSDLIV